MRILITRDSILHSFIYITPIIFIIHCQLWFYHLLFEWRFQTYLWKIADMEKNRCTNTRMSCCNLRSEDTVIFGLIYTRPRNPSIVLVSLKTKIYELSLLKWLEFFKIQQFRWSKHKKPNFPYLLKSWGRLEMMGPYPGALSYSSNSGAATSL